MLDAMNLSLKNIENATIKLGGFMIENVEDS